MSREDHPRAVRQKFPASLAEAIARKASIMAQRLEDQAIRAMVRDAQRALDRGDDERQIRKEMGLT